MIRVAAAADVHFSKTSAGTLRRRFEEVPERADVLLWAGDFTAHGSAEEAAVLADEIAGLDFPMVGVLGNHDYHLGEEKKITDVLEEAGITMLEGSSVTIDTESGPLGVAGTKGFGGGFVGACASDFGEDEMKSFVRHTKDLSAALEGALEDLSDGPRVALLHYAPVEGTLQGERLEIYPFLGSYLLGACIDRAGADLVLHGHAHAGVENGVTPAGIAVRNVAEPVIGQPFAIYSLSD
ncbi:MAG: metallophosphoesterase [Actinomycetota bacterium]|nr:metallophosphoesterase [Actinomycetota bacterium]